MQQDLSPTFYQASAMKVMLRFCAQLSADVEQTQFELVRLLHNTRRIRRQSIQHLNTIATARSLPNPSQTQRWR
jgi:hypothetical protein